MVKKINIFQFACFDHQLDASNRIRKTIATRLDPSNFFTIAFGERNLQTKHFKTINPYSSSKFIRLLSRGIPPVNYVTRGYLPLNGYPGRSKATIFDFIYNFSRKTFPSTIDILHGDTYPLCLPLLHLLKKKNKKMKHVLTVHLFPESWTGKPAYYSFVKKLAENADIVTGVSEYVKADVERFLKVKCKVINDGVNTNFFLPKKHYNNKLTILFVGSLQRRKRPHYVALLSKEFPDCNFIIHGRGEMLSFLRALKNKYMIKNLRIDTSILSRDSLKELYRTADLFLFPSLHEGLPNVILEAMASGLPIIASNKTSHPELVEHGINGFLCESLDEFKMYLHYLISNETVRKKQSINSRKKALCFDWNIIVHQWKKLYKNLYEGGDAHA
jgi:glycosyltransferase involved in cell wall biosynthesis